MARGVTTSAADVKTKHKKEYLGVREQAEQQIMESEPQEKPIPMQKLVTNAQKMFDSYIENYPELNIKHSQLLTTLVLSTMEYNKIAATIRKLPVLDENRPLLEKRAQAYSKEVAALLKEINNIKTLQFKQAIDIAKITVEKMKADNMNGANQPKVINPLDEMLEEED